MKYFAILLAAAAVFVNCAHVYIEAPSGRDVKLQTVTTDSGIKTTMKCTYLFWGFKPLSNNSTMAIIEAKNLKSIKVHAYYTFLDALLSCVTLGIYTSRTLEIQGDVK